MKIIKKDPAYYTFGKQFFFFMQVLSTGAVWKTITGKRVQYAKSNILSTYFLFYHKFCTFQDSHFNLKWNN